MVLGPRFLVEAGFIVAVAVAAGIGQVGTWSIIGFVAGAWILVALVELGLWARHGRQRPQPQREQELPPPQSYRRIPRLWCRRPGRATTAGLW